MNKITAVLLKPLDGGKIGSTMELSREDFDRLEALHAVRAATGKMAAAPANKMASPPVNKAVAAPAEKVSRPRPMAVDRAEKS